MKRFLAVALAVALCGLLFGCLGQSEKVERLRSIYPEADIYIAVGTEGIFMVDEGGVLSVVRWYQGDGEPKTYRLVKLDD